MYRLPPQPLLAPVGYRIPIRGRAPEVVVPLLPLAARLGAPAGRGRGRGKGKGKGRQKNKPKGGNKKTANKPIKIEEKVEEVMETTTLPETAADEGKDDNIPDENWQVISEETEETDSPQIKTENYVDFHSDMFDTNSTEGFNTFSEPMLVISEEAEAPAATKEEVPTEEVTDEVVATEQPAIEETVTEDTQANNDSKEIIIMHDDEAVSNVEQTTAEQTTPVKEPKERPSPNITAITAPKPPSPTEVTKTPDGSLHCQV